MLGWSAGATLEVPSYAVEHSDKLKKIVLYGVRYQNKSRTQQESEEILKKNDAEKNRMADPTATDRWAGLGTEADMVIPGLFDVYTPLHLASDPLAEKNDNKVRAPWGRFTPYFNQATMQQPDKITVPTLIIRGEYDTYAVLEDNQKLFDALAGDDNKLVTIKDGGHFLHMENVNLAFYEALDNFLTE